MSKVVLNAESLGIMRLFENITKARVKDCIMGDTLIFVVQPRQSGLAIGKGGSNIRKLETKFKKKVIVKEFSEDVAAFVKNLLEPIKGCTVSFEDRVVTIACGDRTTRSKVIGRDRKNISFVESVVKRYFPITKIVVE